MFVVNKYNEDAQKRRERQHNNRELSPVQLGAGIKTDEPKYKNNQGFVNE